ncbi:uncharacterized protein LOC113206594 [Frankliniella occidentalis]|uniref:Uncharacterized protein LOC113206594 n=1 Tax=Frankliniella occidentalis TaxID=133901 RepID=A0A6J1SBG0_FRAOC|nr:uncharacterized protein LOC113206594 [Frankliniella occidentalis]
MATCGAVVYSPCTLHIHAHRHPRHFSSTMRVPYTVPRETLRTYDCSREVRRLAGEFRRRLKTESVAWDKNNAPTLKHLAVQALVQNFSSRTALNTLPIEDFHRLLETLPTTVPLEISVPLVPDGEFWRRLATHTWPSTNNVVGEHGGSWRRLVLERRLQHELEAALPPMLDEALRLARLAGPHVRRVRLDQLLHTAGHPAASDFSAPHLALHGGWTPDVTYERRELHMFDSELDALKEDLCNVFGCLVNLEELDVMFGMHDFEKNLSEPPNPIKVASCQALGKTLSTLPVFRRLRVRRSQLHLEKLAGLLEPMHGSTTLAELDLSHCYLGDKGMQVVAAFLLDQASLRVLRVANNKFGARGATHLAKSLLHKTCPPLAELDVSLNSIGDVGGHNILMAAVPRDQRLPLRDPAEDEHVREIMAAEEKERLRKAATEEEPSHEGITIFRGLVQRAIAGELVSSPAPVTAAEPEQEYFDWEVEPEEQARRPSALLASIVTEAHHVHREEAQAEEARAEEERRRREAAAKAAERWEGCPERLQALGLSACRLGAAAGRAVALLLANNRALSSLSLANNHLGQEACGRVVCALQANPRVLQLDLRMCGASLADQTALERALAANNAALRQPLPLRDMLQEREAEHRLRLATTTEVLGAQWVRAQGLPRGQRSSIAVPSGADGVLGSDAATSAGGSLSFSGIGSTGGFSGLSQQERSQSGSVSVGGSAANGTRVASETRAPSSTKGLKISSSQHGSGKGSLRSSKKLAESSTLSRESHASQATKSLSSLSAR